MKTKQEIRKELATQIAEIMRIQFMPAFAAICETAKPHERSEAALILETARELVDDIEALGNTPEQPRP